MSSRDLAHKLYVGNLPRGVTEGDLTKEFDYYGNLSKVWVARNPPGFAFVEFEDERDAEDAIRGMDGKDFQGSRIRVERSNGKSREKPWLNGDRDNRCYECGEAGHFASACDRRDRRNRSRSRSPRRRSRSRD